MPAIVAEELNFSEPFVGIKNDPFRVKSAEVFYFETEGFGAKAGPSVDMKPAAAMIRTANDYIICVTESDVADAETTEVEADRVTKAGVGASDDLVRIEERNQQSLATRNRVAEAEQEMTLGRGRETLDIQRFGFFGGKRSGFSQVESGEPLVPKQIVEQGPAGPAYGSEVRNGAGRIDVGCEKTSAARAIFAASILPMRTDPENPIANAGSAFEVGFVELGKEAGEIILLQRRPAMLRRIESEDVVFIIGYDENV